MYVMKNLDLGNRPYDRPTEKSCKKCLFREKEVRRPYDFGGPYDRLILWN